MTLFVQLYESNTEAVKSEIATFLEAFPNGVVWGNTNNGAGYDLVLLGQVEPTQDRRRRDRRQRLRPARVRADRAVAARDRHELGGRSVRDLRRPRQPTCSRGCATRRSTATATCGCSTSPASG